jgi:hypothetical protein
METRLKLMKSKSISGEGGIRLRQLRPTDIPKLDELWNQHWSDRGLPGLNSRIIDAVAVNDNDKVVGYGQVKAFAEAMLFLDPTARKRELVQATKLLMLEAFRGVEQSGLEDIYCFIKNPQFATLIANHYDFEIVENPGELLLRRLTNGW